MNRVELLTEAIRAALKAGDEILEVYDSKFDVVYKDDKSPLTLADKRAHELICNHLKPIGLPVLSEEGNAINYEQRKEWDVFWMVDPLDGTKEFVKRNGEFTVNIALIEQGKPTLGVVYAPVTKTLYFSDQKAYKIQLENIEVSSLKSLMSRAMELPLQQKRESYVIVASRSHRSQETIDYIEEQQRQQDLVKVLSVGSSLKLCMVAEAAADVYPKFGPTMEWDIAAGQAIVVASGAKVMGWKTKKMMCYNKENLLNAWFVVSR